MKLIAAIFISLFLFTGVAQAGTEFCPSPYAVARHFGSVEGDRGFNPIFDMNDDGAVTVGDIILAANCWLERHG